MERKCTLEKRCKLGGNKLCWKVCAGRSEVKKAQERLASEFIATTAKLREQEKKRIEEKSSIYMRKTNEQRKHQCGNPSQFLIPLEDDSKLSSSTDLQMLE